jgi:predicted nucleic acid-binding protein
VKLVIALDAGVFDTELASARTLRAVARQALLRNGEVWVCAVTLAEVCRGTARTRQVESLLSRHSNDPTFRVRDTDERFAKRVGQILHEAKCGSEAIADAHVVALCADAEAAVVFTTDPTDIVALSAVVPGTRIVTRRP